MESKLKCNFGQRKVLLPVIHVDNQDQALNQCALAWSANCKGVFLINHRMRHTKFNPIIEAVIKEFNGDMWIGVNYLDVPAIKAVDKLPIGVDGLWVDNAYIHQDEPLGDALEMWKKLQYASLTYFGSVAFKHQKVVTDLEQVCKAAAPLLDVVTTSGEETGVAAYIGKIAHMKKYIGETPLGLASGVTPDNVNEYLPYVDAFLVATGISKSFTEFDLDKMTQLNKRINDYED